MPLRDFYTERVPQSFALDVSALISTEEAKGFKDVPHELNAAFFQLSAAWNRTEIQGDLSEAIRVVRSYSRLGNGFALTFLGWAEITGTGLKKNINLGIEHLEAAISLGIGAAARVLGQALFNGKILERDREVERGVELLLQAAELGDLEANVVLAKVHANFGGVFSDENEFEKRLLTVIDAGPCPQNPSYGEACSCLIFYYLHLSSKIYSKETIINLIEKAANAGDAFGHYFQGILLLEGFDQPGDFIPYNEEKGIEHLKSASDAGVLGAILALGIAYYEGKFGLDQDIDKGLEFIHFAASNESAEANFILGTLFQSGQIGKREIGAAAFHYGEAARLGHAEAIKIIDGFGYLLDRAANAHELYEKFDKSDGNTLFTPYKDNIVARDTAQEELDDSRRKILSKGSVKTSISFDRSIKDALAVVAKDEKTSASLVINEVLSRDPRIQAALNQSDRNARNDFQATTLQATITENAAKQLGSLLSKLRKEAGLTQSEIGKLIGKDDRAIRRLEAGDGNPTLETITKYIGAVGGGLTVNIDIGKPGI